VDWVAVPQALRARRVNSSKTFDTMGPLAKSADDAALIMSALTPRALPAPPPPPAPSALRIGRPQRCAPSQAWGGMARRACERPIRSGYVCC
jgi:Asp-tRNA(Asn)/Glu-tRNA(Gln) amidotransferase A subunit family amidase